MLSINALCFSFEHKRVFSSLSLVFPYQRHLLIGENGAGKTSLFAIIAGLYDDYSGDISFKNSKLSQNNRTVAIASALIELPEFVSAAQLLDLHKSQWRHELKHRPLAQIESAEFESEVISKRLGFDSFMTTKVGHLSSGNLQKLRLILALSRPSQLLLLDEACSAMDKASQAIFYKLISEYSGQIIAISHEAGAFSQDYIEVSLSS